MARHYGIMTDLTNAPRETALIDVSVESSIGVRFGVFVGGAAQYSNVQATSANLFVSSSTSSIPNLFGPSNGGAALVVAETVDASTPPNFINASSVAILRQRSGTTKNLVTLPREEIGAGTSFSFPMGDVAQGATAFVASLDGPVTVNYQFGTGASASVAVPSLSVGKIPIPSGATKVSIWTGSGFGTTTTVGARIVVLLGVDTGKVDETFVLPFSP